MVWGVCVLHNSIYNIVFIVRSRILIGKRIVMDSRENQKTLTVPAPIFSPLVSLRIKLFHFFQQNTFHVVYLLLFFLLFSCFSALLREEKKAKTFFFCFENFHRHFFRCRPKKNAAICIAWTTKNHRLDELHVFY